MITMGNFKYQPDLAIPPGETLQEILDEENMTQKDLAIRLGVTPKHVNKIIKGTAPISHETAIKLESVLSMPAKFWINLETEYQDTISRLAALPQLEEEAEMIKHFSYSQMAEYGWVEKTKDLKEKVINLRSFFRVASLESIPLTLPAAFRKSKNYQANAFTLAAWINQVETEARDMDTDPFSKEKLREIIPQIRTLTKLPFKASKSKLIKLCSAAGISLVFVPHISKTYVNGATKWLTNNRVAIGLSIKGSYEDIMWFSFFHELGHVLQEKKNTVFIDGDDYNDSKLEEDADNFALNTLIPKVQYDEFISNKHYQDKVKLRGFSEDVDIHIGIIVGRLMKDGYIPYKNKAYEKLRRQINNI